MTKFGLRTLVYHETVPGHHFQLALTVENPRCRDSGRLRLVRRRRARRPKGGRLYAETTGGGSGWYEGDPEGLLGQLDNELFRARRLVVDTGIHAKRWTRQQAIDYGIEASEVERYVVDPGQACSVHDRPAEDSRAARAREDAAEGPFSERAFHNAVLEPGIGARWTCSSRRSIATSAQVELCLPFDAGFGSAFHSLF